MIQDCVSNHQQCRAFATESLPSRLLAVTGHHSFPKVRLEELSGVLNWSFDYVCLSYCWGRDQSGILTQELLVPCFRYLWVDAYCIIQDSEDDKDSEIAKTASLYSGAACTIFILSEYAASG
ncbi:hypothetical protein LZ31DRAFT_222902 [Colletotrichum somersetense]|nr:hypothetical protein LZ31DRAFT_222902 [Colletotrichum somersetense]